jgi:hypothetical protein
MGEFMNKQELIDNAVHELKGVLRNHKDYWFENLDMFLYYPEGSFDRIYLCTTEEFQQRARELGYVNGYRYGVEYPTNGSKPDLPDDVIIQLSAPMCRGALSVFAGSAMCAAKGATFKITDARYKPEDTSYLDEYFAVQGIDQQKIKNTLISDIAERGWFCYETQKALRLPPVGEVCQMYAAALWFDVKVIGEDDGKPIVKYMDCGNYYPASPTEKFYRPLDHETRKAEAERKRVVDAAYNAIAKPNGVGVDVALSELYDLGYLRMPEDK